MAEKKLVSVRELSEYLGIARSTLVTMTENGLIPALAVGNTDKRFYRYDLEEVKKVLKVHGAPEDANDKQQEG